MGGRARGVGFRRVIGRKGGDCWFFVVARGMLCVCVCVVYTDGFLRDIFGELFRNPDQGLLG